MGRTIINKNKKAILFTITTIFLLLSLFLLTSAFLDRNKELHNVMSNSAFGDKFSYMEDDVVSNSYQELLDINFEGVERSSTVLLKFDQFFLSPSRLYEEYMQTYKTLIENKYSTLNNLNITLTAFNPSFTVEPYNTTLNIQGVNLTVLTMPASTNYIESITAYIKVKQDFSCDGDLCKNQGKANNACERPANDPSPPVIDITWEDSAGFECNWKRKLDPTEDNDKVNGRQFYVEFLNGGTAEVKFGNIDETNGVFKLITDGIEANVTELDIEYSSLSQNLVLKGGFVTIKSNLTNITKTADIILYKE